MLDEPVGPGVFWVGIRPPGKDQPAGEQTGMMAAGSHRLARAHALPHRTNGSSMTIALLDAARESRTVTSAPFDRPPGPVLVLIRAIIPREASPLVATI